MPDLPSGQVFEAVRLQPEGWVVLSPWITTPEGHLYRLHILSCAKGHGDEARAWCEHTARQLNGGGRDA